MRIVAMLVGAGALLALYVWCARANAAQRLRDARMPRRSPKLTRADVARYARALRRS